MHRLVKTKDLSIIGINLKVRGLAVSTSKWNWLLNLDRPIFKLAVAFVIVLVIAQMAHINDKARLYISKVDRLEGNNITLDVKHQAESPLQLKAVESPVGYFQSMRESRVLNLRLIKPSKSHDILVVLNGKVVDDFRSGSVRVVVYEGDYVEVDASEYQGLVQAIVNVVGDKVSTPIDGLMVEGSKMAIPIGNVKFR